MRHVTRYAALVLALVAAVLVAATTFAQSQTPPPRPRMGRGGPGGAFQQLNLTGDQRTKIQALVQQQRQAHQADRQKMMDLQQQLKAAIFADNGPADTSALQQQIESLQAQLEGERVNLQKQIASVLTPDQRKQVRSMPGPGFMGGRGMGMGRGRGMQDGPQW